MARLLSLLRNLFRRNQVEQDLDDEVRSYLDSLVEEKLARGIGENEARRLARLELGGVDQVKEIVRERRTGASLELLTQEIKYALRVLRKSPAFTAVTISTIALGIGANTAVFSVFNTVMLRPLPYNKPQQIVALWEKRFREDILRGAVSAPDFRDWRRLAKTLSAVALYDTQRLNIANGGDAELIPGARVTAGFFEVLQVQPMMGRTFQIDDEDSGRQGTAILTYGTWRQRFGGDTAILGKPLSVNGETLQIIGVLPQGFEYPFAASCDLFVPIRFTEAYLRFRGIHQFGGIARIRDGVTIEQARAEMDVISKQLEREHPDTNVGHAANLIPLQEDRAGTLRPALLVLLGAALLIILIACANVASLLLARSSVRAREAALKAALGCSKPRLILQSFIESAVLAVAGAGFGILLAWWGLAALRSAFFARLDIFATVERAGTGVDWRVLLFTLGCIIVSTLLFGVSPALSRAGVPLNAALRSGGRGLTSSGTQRFRSALIVIQVSLSLMLLTGAGLLGKSFVRLIDVDPGFRTEQVVVASITLPGASYRTTNQSAAFYDALIDRTGALPGVHAAGVTDVLPLTGDDNRTGAQIEGYDPQPGERIRMNPRLVSTAYLQAMGIRLLDGRMFTSADANTKPQVGIVSAGAARKYWPGVSPVGKRFQFTVENAQWIEVVGVVASVHNLGLDRESTADVYLPYRENPFLFTPTRVSLVVKADAVETALAAAIRPVVAGLDRTAAVSAIRSMETQVSDSVAPKRFNLILLALFASLSLILAAAGLYGILSYLVSQRTAEIGIRMALGAAKGDVLLVVVGRGLLLALAGSVIGTAVSLAAAQVMSKLLFGVQPRDPEIFAAAPAILLAIALLSSYIPARRAARVDPLTALRME